MPGSSAGCTQTLNRMSSKCGEMHNFFYIFEKNTWISPDSNKRQQHHKMENACPIFDAIAVSCNGGCVMRADFACGYVTSLSAHRAGDVG